MKYTARLEDDGEDVVCTAVQADLYSGSIQSRMGVSAAAEPGPAIPVGAIIGIVLGVLFLLFLCVALLLLFLCWDRIKYKKKVRKKGRGVFTLFSISIHEAETETSLVAETLRVIGAEKNPSRRYCV